MTDVNSIKQIDYSRFKKQQGVQNQQQTKQYEQDIFTQRAEENKSKTTGISSDNFFMQANYNANTAVADKNVSNAYGDDLKGLGMTSGMDTFVKTTEDTSIKETGNKKADEAENKKETEKNKKIDKKDDKDKDKKGAEFAITGEEKETNYGTDFGNSSNKNNLSGLGFGALSSTADTSNAEAEKLSSEDSSEEDDENLSKLAKELRYSHGVNCYNSDGSVNENEVKAALKSMKPEELLKFDDSMLKIIENKNMIKMSSFDTAQQGV